MTLEKITKSNISLAIRVQEELFPDESGRANLEESLESGSGFAYYLILDEENCAGIIGLYSYPEDPESAWLGWFGIRENFRRKHLGSKALEWFEKTAEAEGYRFTRLYTDALDNEAAIAFYKSNGYLCEPYRNLQDPACIKLKTLIFSKALSSEKLLLWNSRNIHLTEQIAKQQKYSRSSESSPLSSSASAAHKKIEETIL